MHLVLVLCEFQFCNLSGKHTQFFSGGSFFFWGNKREYLAHIPGLSRVLYMSYDRFLLAMESHDLSQAEKSIIWVSSFSRWVMGSRTSFSVSQQLRPEVYAKWMLSIFSDLPLTRKTEKNVYFSNMNIFEWWNWPKYQLPSAK